MAAFTATANTFSAAAAANEGVHARATPRSMVADIARSNRASMAPPPVSLSSSGYGNNSSSSGGGDGYGNISGGGGGLVQSHRAAPPGGGGGGMQGNPPSRNLFVANFPSEATASEVGVGSCCSCSCFSPCFELTFTVRF